jgi:hypothetical protein
MALERVEALELGRHDKGVESLATAAYDNCQVSSRILRRDRLGGVRGVERRGKDTDQTCL